MTTITRTVLLETIECGGCGIIFAVPDWKLTELNKTGQTFWCPNGHARHFVETTEQKLRRQLERAEARATHAEDQRQAAERSATTYKGQATRLRKRVANGVCPCCDRSFTNLGRHMMTQHPDYATKAGA